MSGSSSISRMVLWAAMAASSPSEGARQGWGGTNPAGFAVPDLMITQGSHQHNEERVRTIMPTLPIELGFRMPAEWEPHEATWIAWPHNAADWPRQFAP